MERAPSYWLVACAEKREDNDYGGGQSEMNERQEMEAETRSREWGKRIGEFESRVEGRSNLKEVLCMYNI